uniref:Phytanoyl-dioxygenase n=1 Tax=Tetraselmis sp. GSL018 TaxID=582737 RepID=A0A061RZK2_9CHLO
MQQVAAMPNVRRVLESGRLFELMANLFQDPEVVTSDFKWLRAVAPGEFTGVHTDRVFLGKGSSRLLTAWIPLGDCPVEEGSMMVVPGSHRMEEFSALRSSYGNSEVGQDGTRSGWLTDDGSKLGELLGPSTGSGAREAVQWHTSDFKAGDMVVLSIDTLHMSAANRSGNIRISCDTRWLPASEPRDPRLAAWNSRREKRPSEKGAKRPRDHSPAAADGVSRHCPLGRTPSRQRRSAPTR